MNHKNSLTPVFLETKVHLNANYTPSCAESGAYKCGYGVTAGERGGHPAGGKRKNGDGVASETNQNEYGRG